MPGRTGIETVYQDLALFDNLDAAANFYAGRELAGPRWLPRGLRFLRAREMDEATREVLDRFQVHLPDGSRHRSASCPAASARPWRWPARPRSARAW